MPSRITETLVRGGVGVGLLTTVSCALVGVSVGAICGSAGLEFCGAVFGALLGIDGLLQLPALLRPVAGAAATAAAETGAKAGAAAATAAAAASLSSSSS